MPAPFPCACCGHRTLAELPGRTGQICPVCFWEDSVHPEGDEAGWNGSNGLSLEEAQENFERTGVCAPAFAADVRPAGAAEARDPAFRTARGERQASEAAVRSLIHSAFENIGGGVSLREAALEMFGDPNKESPPINMGRIRGWRNLTHEILGHPYFASAPSFFDPAGHRYHLPAYLCVFLDGDACRSEFHMYDSILQGLSEMNPGGPTLDRFGLASERLAALDPPQRHAVAAFLDHLARFSRDGIERENAQTALARGWSDLLEPPQG